MVLHKGDGARRVSGHEGALEEAGQVDVAVGGGGGVQVEVEGDVEQAHEGHGLQVALQLGDVAGPVLAHGRQGAAGGAAQLRQPAGEEVGADVLEGVQAQAVDAGGLHVPAPPAVHLGADGGVDDVDVGAHEVVVVAELVVDVLVPLLALEEPDPLLVAGLVPVGAVEAGPVPGEVRVGAGAPREGVAGPGGDLLGLTDGARAVVGVDGRGAHDLGGVPAHAVVEDDVRHDADAGRVQGLDGGEVVLLGAVLGGDGALLVELAQVVGVVDAVADVLHAGLSLVGGRQPHRAHPAVGQEGGVVRQEAPVGGVGGQVPGEGLEQEGVDDVVRVGGAGLGVVLGHGSDAASPPPRTGTFPCGRGPSTPSGTGILSPNAQLVPGREKMHRHAQDVPGRGKDAMWTVRMGGLIMVGSHPGASRATPLARERPSRSTC